MIELSGAECSPCHDAPAPLPAFPRVTEPLSYDEFFREYLEKNRPCVFSARFTEGWRTRRAWVAADGTPDVDYLARHFGEAKVPVANCDQKHYDSQEKKTYTLQEYIQYWKNARESSEGKKLCLYLKDWHFVQAYPDYGAYTTLQYFASDWLNEFWKVREDIQDDYQFVYLGPKGSWTPFHADVFRSYSWSTNICGRKRWVFYPPGEEQYLRDTFGTPVYDIDSTELSDTSKYPKAASASGRLEVIQEQGQTIFVPSGWYHQVWNLEDTISINHNWLNGTNIHIAWEFLVESLNQVEYAIQDCSSMDEWPEQCQLLLRATHGMDYHEFYVMLRTVARRRINLLRGAEDVISFGQWRLGKNHATYDLRRIKWCLEKLLDDQHTEGLRIFSKIEEPPSQLLEEVTVALS